MQTFINVDVALHRADSWVLIVRSEKEEHAAGMLSLVGGTFEETEPVSEALEATARREVAEEIGVSLDGPLRYVESTFFVSDSGDRVLNVVLMAPLGEQEPVVKAPDEVADVVFRTLAELEADASCPPWTVQSIRKAKALLDSDHR
ncbi:NUDIX domain-containing protein [Kitasatospora aureofaciens]|uniref:NUDIX domain-containing protein n=1 Tax=Kitasatospora aureofaciens TaxID=1894 RepID=UPI0033FCBDD1